MVKKKEKKSSLGFFIRSIIGLILVIGLGISYHFYKKIFKPDILINSGQKEIFFYIPTNSTFEDVVKLLVNDQVIKEEDDFIWVAKKTKYTNNVHAGRFLLKQGMSNYELVKFLRPGNNIPVKLVINNLNYKEDLAGAVSKVLETDSVEILKKLNDNEFLSNYGFNTEEALIMFIPNTYEFYWNTNVEDFFSRMKKEFDDIWDSSRQSKARSLNLTPKEVTILASIVQKETSRKDEWKKIARVYLNRIRRGMLLQADPTIKYLYRGEIIKRIKKKHLDIDSPYNTYENGGLPPGPITLAEIEAIDAVLNAEDHNYIYFCAKPDRSGYHNFSRTLRQHNRYAREYWNSLNKRKIR